MKRTNIDNLEEFDLMNMENGMVVGEGVFRLGVSRHDNRGQPRSLQIEDLLIQVDSLLCHKQ